MTLPYEHATSGQSAIGEMQKILSSFGATSFGCMENFERGEVTIQFEHRGRRVTITASTKGYAAAWLKAHPRPVRSRDAPVEYEQKALKRGKVAVYSILRDWIKGQITAVETGMLSFEGAFLGQLMLQNGQTVLDRLKETKMLETHDYR